MNDDIKRPDRLKLNGYRRRNPSIQTLMKTQRFVKAAPKHEQNQQMERIIFDVSEHELGSTMAPKIQRLESVINRLRIENSHVISKADTLQSKNDLLQKTLKHSKQQYAVIEAENKKLKTQHIYLHQQLKELQHKSRGSDDDDVMSIVNLKTQVQNLEDIQRKVTAKNKKIKQTLEEVINDPGLPFPLRSKLWSVLPQFYISHHATSPSSLSAQMKLEFIESDHEPSPESSPIPTAKPKMSIAKSVDKKSKLMHYKKRKVSHNRHVSESMSMRGYVPPVLNKLRSVSISNTSMGGNIDSVLSKTRNASLLDDDLYLFEELESENEDKKIEILPWTQNRKAAPAAAQYRPIPPPPPPRIDHAGRCASDGLTQMATGMNMKRPNAFLNLSEIHEDVRTRSASENIHSPSSHHRVSISPPKLISIPLETPQVTSDEEINHENNLQSIQKRGRTKTKEPKRYRGKAHTAWTPHIRSKSHQPTLHTVGTRTDTPSPDSEEFSIDSDNLFSPKQLHLAHKSKSKFFHIDLGWGSKKKKKKKNSIKLSKKEENKLNIRRSLLRSNKSKTTDVHVESDDVSLTVSKTSLTDESDEAVMNVNPLSPASSNKIEHFSGFKEHFGLLSSPESNALSSGLKKPSTLEMSVSTPPSPLLKPLKPNSIQNKVKSIDDIKRGRKAKRSVVFNDRDDSPRPPMDAVHKPVPKVITRMDQIRMTREGQKQKKVRQKRFYSATPVPVVNIPKRNPTIQQSKSQTPIDSPVPGSHLTGTRRRSLSMKQRKKRTQGTFEIKQQLVKEPILRRGRRAHTSTHTRSMSLLGLTTDVFSFSLSPRTRKNSKVKDGVESPRERKKKSTYSFKRKRSDDSWSGDSFDGNKVWTLKDLISEMVSTGYEEETDRIRNALILCYSTFTTGVNLFEELRRFFRMSLTVMTSTILYFEDDNDDTYISQDDRRWHMRHKITQCIIYWIKEFWIQDFAQTRELQKEIEMFKSDIRTCIQDLNRSKPLIESLMQTLTYINSKYGGINAKNLNINVPISIAIDPDTCKNSNDVLIELEDDDIKEGESSSETQQYETSVVIHEDMTDNEEDEEDENDMKQDHGSIIIKTKEEKKQELEELTKQIRSVTVRFPDLIKLDVAVPHNFNIMELDPEDVAVQLTLLDSFVFKKINGRECIEQNWKTKDKAIKAPNVLKMIAQFNNVSKWVQITILKGETPRLRKRYIKKIISMATYFMQNGNLSSLCAFYNALTSTNISQLHSTWKLLRKSKRKELQEIKALFGWKMNKFKEMQEELQPPCIPHIGIILQILFQIDEGKQNKNPINGSVNYIKMMMLHEQIYHMQMLQSQHYRDEPNFAIQKLLIREFQLQSDTNENALYQMAKQIANSKKK